ncbi:MAG: PEP/pyruvate-binding domain-containing protein, partial [bacterium]|nr:PEP/pyruvate-binding domain-containing protein [bacterium]
MKPRNRSETQLFIKGFLAPTLSKIMEERPEGEEYSRIVPLLRELIEDPFLWGDEETLLLWRLLPHPFRFLNLHLLETRPLLVLLDVLCEAGIVTREHIRDLIDSDDPLLYNNDVLRLFVERGLWTREEARLAASTGGDPQNRIDTQNYIDDFLAPRLADLMKRPSADTQNPEEIDLLKKMVEDPDVWGDQETLQLWSHLPHPFSRLKLFRIKTIPLIALLNVLCENGLIRREHIRELIESDDWLLQKREVMQIFVEHGLWTAEEVRMAVSRELKKTSDPSAPYRFPLSRTHLELWKRADIWEQAVTRRLERKAIRTIHLFLTPAEQSCADFMMSILEAHRRGWLAQTSFDADLFLIDFLEHAEESPLRRYNKAYEHIPVAPPVLQPGNPLGKVAAIVGGKWAGLEMARELDIPTVDGFVFPVGQEEFPEDVARGSMAQLQQRTGKTFGEGDLPLLVSVRSGAPISFAGKMVTVLNVGINDAIRKNLARFIGQDAALDTQTRFIISFSKAVFGIDATVFEPLEQEGIKPEV